MSAVAVVAIAAVATIVALAVGYGIGVARDRHLRRELRAELDAQRRDFRTQLDELTRSMQSGAAMQQVLENEVKAYLTEGAPSQPDRFRAELDVILRALVEAERSRSEGLRATMHDLFQPLLNRERVAAELDRLQAAGDRSQLPVIVDDITRTGGFSVVLLTDEDGLPLAVSSGTDDAEHHAGLATMLMLLVERLARVPESTTPTAIALYSEHDEQTLCRIFEVSGQRLMLSAVAAGETLSPFALDPAVADLEHVLAGRE